MKQAWIDNEQIRDIAPGNPEEIYHPDIAKFYDTEVPDDAENGDGWLNGALVKRPAPIPSPATEPVAAVPPKVDVITYKMLFTSAERIATKTSTDPVIHDFQDLMNDPRTQNVDLSLKSVQDALDYMTTIGILAEGRKAEILTGIIK